MNALPCYLRLLLALCFTPFLGSHLFGQLAITEFLASNQNGLTDELGANEDWIEIQNTSASPVSLSGWYLTDDQGNLRKWPFPAWTLNAGNRLVLFASSRDKRPVQATPGSDNAGTVASPRLATNFKLTSNEGGYIALSKDETNGGLTIISVIANYPRQFSNITCGISATPTTLPGTPLFAVGQPGILKYLVPNASTPSTWNTTGFDDSSWTAASGTAVGFDSDQTGATSFVPHFTVNLGTPATGVPHVMWNVNASLYTRYAFDVADKSAFTILLLKIKYEDGFVAWLNGVEVARGNFAGTPLYNSGTGTNRASENLSLVYDTFDLGTTGLNALQNGTNVLAIQGINFAANSSDFLLAPSIEGSATNPIPPPVYFLTATPGAANSAERTALGPIITNVTKNPEPRPTGTAASPPLVITAKVVPSLKPLAAANPVQLKYLVMFGAESSLNMADNGIAPDLLPGDGIYTAQIPTSALGAGQMLRWRVVATDNAGTANTAPEYVDPIDNEQYYGTVASDTSIESSLPILYWFTPVSNAGDTAVGTRNSFFYKAIGATTSGRFYDNVEINLHGQSSSGFAKHSYDLDFNQDNRFEWNVANKRVKDVNLLTNWGDKSKTHNQMTHELLATIGSVHHWCHQVRIQQVTPANAATPANHFWSIADLMEDGDEDFIARNGRDPNGVLYKIYDTLSATTTAEKKSRLYEDKSDLQALITGLTVTNALSARRQFAYDNLDLPQCVSYFVGLALVSSQDNGHKNYYVYRDSEGTREWSILPWDVDLTWGRNWLQSSGYFTDTIFTDNDLDLYNTSQQSKGENRLYSLIVGHSDIARLPAGEFRDMVLRRLRTVMDSYFSAPGVLEGRFATLADMMDPPGIGTSDADRDYSLGKGGIAGQWGTWGTNGGFTAGGEAMRYHMTNQLVGSYLTGRRAFLQNATLAGATVPSSQPANAKDLITIETVDFKPSTGNQDHEFFVVRNSNSYPVDLSGWQITGAVTWTFKPGTVLPPGGGVTENLGDLYVARNPYLFRQRATVSDDGLPGANQYRFVQGPYRGQLSARGGEAIELRDPAGTLVRTKTWTASPTLAQNQLRVTEINYNPAPPTVAESTILNITAGDFEFLELTNTGATALNIGGATFKQGVTFTFPANYTVGAGASVLVVANQAAFIKRYGAGKTIAGTYLGNLDNSGETIELVDGVGEVILDFTYNNSWFPTTDGAGKTLVVSDATAPYTSWDLGVDFWRASIQTNGTPGSAVYNIAPVAAADSASVAEDNTLTVPAPGVLGNDTDTEATELQAFLVTAPAVGTLNLALDGSYTYTPPANFNGPVTFTYQASDSVATSNTVTVTITVTAVNDVPAFATDPILLNAVEDSAFSAQLVASDADTGAVLTFAKLSGPAWLSISPSGACGGTPANADVGLNTFSVQASDGTASVTAVLKITVANTNDAPAFAANPVNMAATGGAAFTGQLSATDPDAGDILTFTKQSGPAWLTVSPSGALGGTPSDANAGLNAFTVSVSDGTETVTAALNITVTVSGTTLTGFINANFTPAERNDPLISGSSADPDNDGVSNLLEYAFGSDPRSPLGTRLPQALLIPVQLDQRLGMSYTRVKGATDLTFILEFSNSPDPAGFTASALTQVSLIDNGNGTETVTFREETPAAPGAPARFVRLRVQQN